MPDASTFELFLAAALIFLLVPGPSVLYVVARSVDQGRLAGLVSVLGIQLGTTVHIAFAAAGLSAILASSAAAFALVKWVGVAYLVWLGIQRFLTRDEDEEPDTVDPAPLYRVFSQGILVNILNPKTALFFLAFLPQFVDPSRGSAWLQVVVFGATLAALGVCTDGMYALAGGSIGEMVRQNASLRRARRYVSGGVYLALGALAAVTGSAKH